MGHSKTNSERTGHSGHSMLRQIPAVEELLRRSVLQGIEKRIGRRLLLEVTRKVLQNLRDSLANGSLPVFSIEALEKEIAAAAEAAAQPSLCRVINATGVILHTNLGRAPLAAEAAEHLGRIATHYSNLEYDLDQGRRGKRDTHTDRLFARLLGAEHTLVVNNNAAAVFLTLNTLAEGGEVIVSRGELIEIGGSFRIPDICAKSGAVLREVGTTNRTRISDYAEAINERTRMLLRVHPSNFRIVGFTERPALNELVELSRQSKLPLVEDLGSGCLVDLKPLGIVDEPPVGSSLKAGVDVVTFSGDKLLGGPQAGIILGKRKILERVRRNPLFRALRVDKLTIAALEATIEIYLREEDVSSIPALKMMHTTLDELMDRATRLRKRLAACPGFSAEVVDGQSVIGGGSTPGLSLPTKLVGVVHVSRGATEIEGRLRRNAPPVIARVERNQLLIDLRTVLEEQDEEIGCAFEQMFS